VGELCKAGGLKLAYHVSLNLQNLGQLMDTDFTKMKQIRA
jgi:hypothetical protein